MLRFVRFRITACAVTNRDNCENNLVNYHIAKIGVFGLCVQ